jgi:hypothetical protein
MSTPIELDIPHKLGKETIRQRLDGGVGKMGRLIPGGANVTHRWEGDTMVFTVTAMGQEVASRATVFEDKVHAVVDLPGMLALFAGPIKAAIQQQAPKLLE